MRANPSSFAYEIVSAFASSGSCTSAPGEEMSTFTAQRLLGATSVASDAAAAASLDYSRLSSKTGNVMVEEG